MSKNLVSLTALLSRVRRRSTQLLTLALASSALALCQSPGQVFNGYFQGSNIYMSAPYYPNRLDLQHSNAASRLTYLIYAFADIQNNSCALNDPWGEVQKPFDQASMAVMGQTDSDANSGVTLEGLFHQFQLLKQYNPNLKILISIGGSSASAAFQTAASPSNRQAFVSSCVNLFMKGQYGLSQNYPGIFDGMDVDWEFPGPGTSNGNSTSDQQNYIDLLQEFHNQLAPNAILTAASGVSLNQYGLSNNSQLQSLFKQMSSLLTYFNVMTYDYNYAGTTGFNAPLFQSPAGLSNGGSNNDTVSPNNADASLQIYTSGGANAVPSTQLVLGIPFYGKQWTGVTNKNNGLFQPGSSLSPVYYLNIDKNGTKYCDAGTGTATCPSNWGFPLATAPTTGAQEVWTYNGTTFVSFDDPGSIAAKTKYAQTHNLAGVMVWDLTMDDSENTLVTSLMNDFQPPALQFVPLAAPCRAVDTRNASGAFGGPELGAHGTRTFNLPSSACNIPSTAAAYSLNVTVVPNASLGYLTVWPAGQSMPVVSTLNSDGRIKANAAIVPAGTNGGVNVYATDATQVILDVDGYFVPAASNNSAALSFHTMTPCRLVDTRGAASNSFSGSTFTANSNREYFLTHNTNGCSIPASAKAYSLNYTVVPVAGSETDGYLTTWPSTASQPLVSTLNYTGKVSSNATLPVANGAIVPAGDIEGDPVSVYVSEATNLIIDINGYFAPPTASDANAVSAPLSMYTVTPCRVLDTRGGSGAFNGTLTVNVAGSQCAPPSTAKAYVLNSTVVPPASLLYLTLWPNGQAQPTVSTLNAADGSTTSNMAIVPSTNGSINAFASSSTQLILDVSSYFAQ